MISSGHHNLEALASCRKMRRHHNQPIISMTDMEKIQQSLRTKDEEREERRIRRRNNLLVDHERHKDFIEKRHQDEVMTEAMLADEDIMRSHHVARVEKQERIYRNKRRQAVQNRSSQQHLLPTRPLSALERSPSQESILSISASEVYNPNADYDMETVVGDDESTLCFCEHEQEARYECS